MLVCPQSSIVTRRNQSLPWTETTLRRTSGPMVLIVREKERERALNASIWRITKHSLTRHNTHTKGIPVHVKYIPPIILQFFGAETVFPPRLSHLYTKSCKSSVFSSVQHKPELLYSVMWACDQVHQSDVLISCSKNESHLLDVIVRSAFHTLYVSVLDNTKSEYIVQKLLCCQSYSNNHERHIVEKEQDELCLYLSPPLQA